MGRISQWFTTAADKRTIDKGRQYEFLARKHLEQAGLKFVQANYRAGKRELDLIMQDRETLVFIEVKYRNSDAYGGATAALAKEQINRIKQAASIYMQRCKLNEHSTSFRFDFVAVNAQHKIEWIQNAF